MLFLNSPEITNIYPKGPYSLNTPTSKKEERIEEDSLRMDEFFKIRDFWAERFSSLSLSTFRSNQKLASDSCVPGFDDKEWEATPNGQVFASNLVVTADCFHNISHVDIDHTKYSFGMFGRIFTETGELYDLQGPVKAGDVHKCAFMVQDYGIDVDFDGCNGTVEIIWDTEVSWYFDFSVMWGRSV